MTATTSQPTNNDGSPRPCYWCGSTRSQRRWGHNEDAECVNGAACLRRQEASVDAPAVVNPDGTPTDATLLMLRGTTTPVVTVEQPQGMCNSCWATSGHEAGCTAQPANPDADALLMARHLLALDWAHAHTLPADVRDACRRTMEAATDPADEPCGDCGHTYGHSLDCPAGPDRWERQASR